MEESGEGVVCGVWGARLKCLDVVDAMDGGDYKLICILA